MPRGLFLTFAYVRRILGLCYFSGVVENYSVPFSEGGC